MGSYGSYTADIVQKADYYPFGMLMPGRHVEASTDYRYGYNGMEKDNEVKETGNSYDYGARMYDPRIGRWMSTDPLRAMYPDMSPYCAFANNPVYYVDPYGLSPGNGDDGVEDGCEDECGGDFTREQSSGPKVGGDGRMYQPVGAQIITDYTDMIDKQAMPRQTITLPEPQ